MSLDHEIDLDARLVRVRAHGTLTSEEMFAYQKGVWSRPEVSGFDELIDMSDVEVMPSAPPENVRQLAELSARMDPREKTSRLAIIAPRDLSFGLGRMYETFRGLMQGSTKEVQVFRTSVEALAWLHSPRFNPAQAEPR